MRITLHPGVWVGSLGLCATGALGMTGAALPSQVSSFRIGEVVFAAGVLLFIWGIKWDGQHWWRSLPKLRNPLRRRSGALYTGIMIVSDSELDAKHYFDLSIRAFNGTSHLFQTTKVEGTIKVEFTPIAGGSARGGFVLNSPILYFESGKPFKPDAEFVLGSRLFLSEEQVAEFRRQQADEYQAQLMFQDFVIELETSRGRKMRLPLWDGVTIRGGRIALMTGRVHVARISGAVSVGASLG